VFALHLPVAQSVRFDYLNEQQFLAH
jgi:hypothetical protein